MKKYVLIAAGGSGSRMNNPLPKQFAALGDKPLLFHTFSRFLSYAPDMEFVLVIPEAYIDFWKEMCVDHHFHAKHRIATSGPTRFHSVKSGLRYVPDGSLVAIHDGVRPFVSLDTIARTFSNAEKYGSAIPIVTMNESVRVVDGAFSKSLNRRSLRAVQTPQCFQSTEIKKAYNTNYDESFTDDATVFEASGNRLFLVDGNQENVKITNPADLIYAEALLRELPGFKPPRLSV
jgi:2-C-methyl-D-erythritol 4-phosphate cytidylyltransferase